ncbi:MAG TPA: HD-GYP domain-containing protein [Streptosporangiaceae bacterium]|nr:HD-GYP domain-containing protein [Streptosporangiaceae bacterium]
MWLVTGVTLAALFVFCDYIPISTRVQRSAWSPSSAATLAAVVLLGPVGAGLVGAAAALSLCRLPAAVRIFNGATYSLAGSAAGGAFVLAGRLVRIPADERFSLTPAGAGRSASGGFSVLIWPFVAAAVVHVLISHGLIWQMLRLDRSGHLDRSGDRAPPAAAAAITSARSEALPLAVTDLGFAALGLVVAALWAVVGPFAAAIALVPLYVARWAMRQIAEQRRAHSAILATFCQAVETKDLYTRGHSERVSNNAAMIARQIGMRADRAEAVAFSGLLHDVGKLGVPTMVLRKAGPLTAEERAQMELHPRCGLEIAGHIRFLNEALTGIMHHHERMDGRGYPMGLAGDEIPEFGRIVAVADAFDAMTSDRPYRKALTVSQAISQLRDGAGSHFDPVIVEAFIAGLLDSTSAP